MTARRNTARPNRVGWRLTAFAMTVAGLLLLTAAPAGAHHADISAVVHCDGRVTFTATAWYTTSAAARTNSAVVISYSTDGSRFSRLPQRPGYAFGPDDGFSFGGSFQLSRPLPGFVVVAVQPIAQWGDGAPPAAARTTARLPRPSCPSSAATSPAAPTHSSSAGPTPSSSATPHAVGQGASQAVRTVAPAGLVIALTAVCAGLLTAAAWSIRKATRGYR